MAFLNAQTSPETTSEATAGATATVHQTRLDNGLTVLLEEMPWLPSASFELMVPIGSATDPEGEEGSATVLHDWLQRGAGALDSRRFSEALDGLGLRRGGGAGSEYSSWGASCLADALPEALGYFADMLQRPRLEAREFESARTVAKEELASLADNPAQRMFLALTEAYFVSGHRRSPYGSEEGLAAPKAECVSEDFPRRIGPQNAIVAVAGGVGWEALLGQLEEAFGGWRGRTEPLPGVEVKPAHLKHEVAETAQLQIGVAFEAVAPGGAGWYENALAVSVLSGGMGSRLFSEVREKRALVYSVAAVSRALKGYGYTLGYAGTTPERAEETLAVLLTELGRIREGVSLHELERARTGMLSSLIMQAESSSARAGALVRDSFLFGGPRSLAGLKEQVNAITLDGLNSFLATSPRRDYTIMTLGPERHPSQPQQEVSL